MSEMLNRVAMWLHQRACEAEPDDSAPYRDLPDEKKASYEAAARDLVLTMRRPTLEMRVRGRSVLAKSDEAEVWRAMIDAALSKTG